MGQEVLTELQSPPFVGVFNCWAIQRMGKGVKTEGVSFQTFISVECLYKCLVL